MLTCTYGRFYEDTLPAQVSERLCAVSRQVAGLVGRPERSLESFAACPAPDNPLVAFLGNEGCVPLVSLRSRQCVGDLKMSGTVRTAAFSADGLELLTSGGTCANPPSHHFCLPHHVLCKAFMAAGSHSHRQHHVGIWTAALKPLAGRAFAVYGE